jgi:hypothetical protein
VYLGPTEIHRTTAGAVSCTRYYNYNGRPIATRTDPGSLTWQAVDNHGTAELTINPSTKAIASRLRTDPFGNPRNTNPWPGSHGFVNGTTDPTSLTHRGAREYDPKQADSSPPTPSSSQPVHNRSVATPRPEPTPRPTSIPAEPVYALTSEAPASRIRRIQRAPTEGSLQAEVRIPIPVTTSAGSTIQASRRPQVAQPPVRARSRACLHLQIAHMVRDPAFRSAEMTTWRAKLSFESST